MSCLSFLPILFPLPSPSPFPFPSSIKALSKRIGELEGEKQHLSGTVASLQTQLAAKTSALEEAETQMEELKAKGKEDESRMREEVRSLQKKVSEVMNMVIQQGEKMREVRRAKRETDQENMTLRTSLKKAEVSCSAHVPSVRSFIRLYLCSLELPQ